jgi:hypothetical protein
VKKKVLMKEIIVKNIKIFIVHIKILQKIKNIKIFLMKIIHTKKKKIIKIILKLNSLIWTM